MKKTIFCLLSLLVFIACDVTKKVPEGSYLLNKTKHRF